MDKSINLETEEFVNKLRDLKMGSAPTDILTILTGVKHLQSKFTCLLTVDQYSFYSHGFFYSILF